MHFALDRVSRGLTLVELGGASSLYTGLAIEVPATMTATPATTLAEAVRACSKPREHQHAYRQRSLLLRRVSDAYRGCNHCASCWIWRCGEGEVTMIAAAFQLQH